MNKACGSCNWHGKSEIKYLGGGIEISCLIDNDWHKTDFVCSKWAPYQDNITADARFQGAMSLRNSQDAEKIQWRKYFWDKIFPVIVGVLLTAALTFIVTYYWKNRETLNLKKEIQSLKNQMPEIPVTVIDPATKNQLYIGRPIPKPTHYEFPITLNDGQGSYRIDQYKWSNEFKGVLIIQKPTTNK